VVLIGNDARALSEQLTNQLAGVSSRAILLPGRDSQQTNQLAGVSCRPVAVTHN